MDQNRTKNNFMFIIILGVICLFVFGGIYLFDNDKEIITEIIDTIGADKKVIDNYNGVYSNKEKINGSTTVFEGCMLSYFNNLILIVNDEYFVYRDSCIGTFLKDQGKTKDLDIKIKKETKEYYIIYNDKEYIKNHNITSIEPENRAKEHKGQFYPNDYQLMFKESQFEGNYYSLKERGIRGLSVGILFNHIEKESFEMIFKFSKDKKFNYIIKDFESMPEIRTFGSYLLFIDREKSKEKYLNKLKVFNNDGLVFDLSNSFPIKVDDVVLDENNSIYILFNPKNSNFRLFIGYDLDMCVNDSNSDRITYYEFTVSYNYRTKSFEQPVFVKKGYEKEGCKYIDSVLGG